ncbi:MAG: hypothetical protein ABSD77_08320 [Verrucomicrobiota bacterium]|jgi:hypothetical protein
MQLVTISSELNATEAQMKRARLEAAGFHAVVMNEASSFWMGTAIATGGILVQVPESEAADAREFLSAPVE